MNGSRDVEEDEDDCSEEILLLGVLGADVADISLADKLVANIEEEIGLDELVGDAEEDTVPGELTLDVG